MDWQPKYRPEAASAFFADGRAMRPPVEGTVAQGRLHEDLAFYEGVDPESGKPIARAPIPVDAGTLRHGRERFDIFCAPCHDRTGGGRGLVVQRGFHVPVELSGDRVRGLADGEIFQAMTKGVRNMPAYGSQIPEADRWAIVTYVRALGRSQHAALADVPVELQGKLEPEGGTP
jgi:mono/diheme cytochrome c family protein